MVGDSLAKVTIITSDSFPNGNAPANRLIGYGKGFLGNNYSVEVVVIKPSRDSSNKVFNVIGKYDNINYLFPGMIVCAHTNFFFRQIQYRFSIIASLCFIIVQYFIRKKSEFIIYAGVNPFIELILVYLSRLFKVSIFKEESEYPNLIFEKIKLLPTSFACLLYMKVIYKKYSGILSMTNPLREFFINNGIRSEKIIVVNNAIATERNNIHLESIGEQYFAYVGSLNQQKDGIITLLDALDIVRQTHSEIKLKIAGYGSDIDIQNIFQKVSSLGLEKNVQLLGQLSSLETKKLILNARGLLSARPNSIQADYGFPTKIVEYLATGNPVVTTLTGDLKLYLFNNENVFTAKTNDTIDFARSWLFLLNDLENAKRVGENGYLMVKTTFNPTIETKKILDFKNLILE